MNLEDKIKWSKRENKDMNPLDFFREHYDSSITRSRLARKDGGLYRILSNRGLLEQAIPHADQNAVERGKKKKRHFGDDPLVYLFYYQQHYAGLTRGQLKKKDQSLYCRLRRDGLLSHIPIMQEHRDFGDPLAYYQEHYADLTRGQLWEKDQNLYHRLRNDGLLLEQIPVKKKNFGKDALAYYNEHYPGVTRGQLQKQEPSLYKRLWNDGLLEHIPLKKNTPGNVIPQK
ncbi:MAG: hypothetical protein Q8R37_00880 [Nanoarchaeota archaeon]|nr:hypothetical protein [Nanoarchaeota archaeon]